MQINIEEAQAFLKQMGYQCCELDSLVEATQGTGLNAAILLEKTFTSAQRWESFVRSARFRILGSAGFRGDEASVLNPGYRHVGLEMWTHYEMGEHIDNQEEVKLLERYADTMTLNLQSPSVITEERKRA